VYSKRDCESWRDLRTLARAGYAIPILFPPVQFRGNPNDEDEVIVRKVEQVKTRIAEMIQRGLRERRGVFF